MIVEENKNDGDVAQLQRDQLMADLGAMDFLDIPSEDLFDK